MQPLLMAVVILAVSGLGALTVHRRARLVTAVAAGGAVIACLIGLISPIRVLFGADPESLRCPWSVPGGEFHAGLDALSAFFLIPVFVLSALAAVYGASYMMAWREKRSLAPPWFFFNLFVAGMALVLIARNAVLFLVAWEVMSIAAFFLVTFEHEKRDVRIAGWIYLVAAHFGAACLLAMFLLLGRPAGSLDFDTFGAAAQFAPGMAATVFALALGGFGAKAGLVPLHVWLPEAHPAAPSHVSALMSGVMIKLGIYGILRTLVFLGRPAAWTGPLLVLVGLATAALGVLLAMSQRDIKRSLAYSSIENIGLIVLALGVGFWGLTANHPVVAALGFAGGLLHLWNHALMKGLMFLCAGSILHGTGTRDMDKLGGLMKRMPRTGALMAVGAVAMAALPPLNGFVGEWLIYMGMLRGGLDFSGAGRVVLIVAIGAVALIGGLALVCFVRLIGVTLLGEARSDEARHAHESSPWMTSPLIALVLMCAGSALFPRAVVSAFQGVVAEISGLPAGTFLSAVNSADSPLSTLSLLNVATLLMLLLIALALFVLRRRSAEAADTTWACGYTAPTPRMQYTSLSFSELMVSRMFPRALRPRSTSSVSQGVFPAPGSLTTEYPDPLSRRIYLPFFARTAERFARLRWLQQGKLHVYLLYFVVVLILAFAWIAARKWIVP